MNEIKKQKEQHPDIEKIKKDLRFFNKKKIAEEVKLHHTTINYFYNGHKTLSTDSYLKVRGFLDKIALEILGKKP